MASRTWLSWGTALVILGAALSAACTSSVKPAATSAAATAAAACDACHPAEARTWKETYHAKVARAPHEALLKEAAQYWVKDTKGNAGPTRGNLDGKTYGLDEVEMVVGTRWKQRFLVKNPATGHHQFLDKQWNSYTGVWEGYANMDDWDSDCSNCHATGKAARLVDTADRSEHGSINRLWEDEGDRPTSSIFPRKPARAGFFLLRRAGDKQKAGVEPASCGVRCWLQRLDPLHEGRQVRFGSG